MSLCIFFFLLLIELAASAHLLFPFLHLLQEAEQYRAASGETASKSVHRTSGQSIYCRGPLPHKVTKNLIRAQDPVRCPLHSTLPDYL